MLGSFWILWNSSSRQQLNKICTYCFTLGLVEPKNTSWVVRQSLVPSTCTLTGSTGWPFGTTTRQLTGRWCSRRDVLFPKTRIIGEINNYADGCYQFLLFFLPIMSSSFLQILKNSLIDIEHSYWSLYELSISLSTFK